MLRSLVTQQRLRDLEDQIRQVREHLAKSISGPLYFPYALSDRRPVRAAQGYLTKFPYDLLVEIPELSKLRDFARAEPGEPSQQEQRKSGSRSLRGGRQSDVKLRRAIERHAVETVLALYRSEGYHVKDVGDHESWDITARREVEEIRVEVKGSTGTRDGVDLTEGEVRNGEDYQPTHLVVIDRIDWVRTADGFRCGGGRVRRWTNWTPARSVLIPTAYRYPLPALDDVE
ncbi:MAG: protein NO VEIN domain-containing protein [Pseudonocardiaceae bacterium]